MVDRPPTPPPAAGQADQQQAPLEASGRVKSTASLVLFTRLGPPEEFSRGCTPVYTCKLPGNSQHILDRPWRPAVTLQGARFGMCSKNLMEAFSKYVHEAVEAGPPPASPPHGLLSGREPWEARFSWPPGWCGASLSRLALKGSNAGSRPVWEGSREPGVCGVPALRPRHTSPKLLPLPAPDAGATGVQSDA